MTIREFLNALESRIANTLPDQDREMTLVHLGQLSMELSALANEKRGAIGDGRCPVCYSYGCLDSRHKAWDKAALDQPPRCMWCGRVNDNVEMPSCIACTQTATIPSRMLAKEPK